MRQNSVIWRFLGCFFVGVTVLTALVVPTDPEAVPDGAFMRVVFVLTVLMTIALGSYLLYAWGSEIRQISRRQYGMPGVKKYPVWGAWVGAGVISLLVTLISAKNGSATTRDDIVGGLTFSLLLAAVWAAIAVRKALNADVPSRLNR